MSLTKILLPILSLFLFLSCGKEEEALVVDKYNVDIGAFNLLEESSMAIPYFGGKNILFVDSTGAETMVSVTESNFILNNALSYLYKYDVYEQGDTVKYAYTSESKSFNLEAPSLDVNMRLRLKARPYYRDPESKAVADVLEVYCVFPEPMVDTIFNSVPYSTQVFYHIVNQRTWSDPLGAEKFDEELLILGRTFKNVYQSQFLDPKSKIFYNYEFGILSFTDHTGKTWRFEKME